MTNKPERVIAIIRSYSRTICLYADNKPAYWATLRKASMMDGKLPRDETYNHPDFTWCMDTEQAPTVREAKQLARDYAKKLGVKIARFDERI